MDEAHDHDDLLTWDAAADRVGELRNRFLEGIGTERVPTDEVAGRTLAEAIAAPRPIPEHSHATMDGFAFDADGSYPLEVVDEVYPEDDPGPIEPGTAVAIATGAPLPEGATAVLKREEATVSDGQLTGPDLEAGTYVYERGSNVAKGEELFAAGEVLHAKDAILLGDLGVETVSVRQRLSTAVLATGTEIHEGEWTDLDSPMLAGLVRSWGHEATYEGTVPDDYDAVESRIAELAADHDVVLTTGGTSVGKKDHVIRALDTLGTLHFHRVRLRPGKPIGVATLEDADAVVFAIPGKPLGAYTVTALVARPFFRGSSLATAPSPFPTVEATLERSVALPDHAFAYTIPVTVDDGRAMPLGHRDSPLAVYEDTFDPSVLSSSTRATRADGFVLTESDLEAGQPVRVVPYSVVER